MSSLLKFKRRIGGAEAAPSGANTEGEIAFYLPGAAGATTKPTMYVNDGGGWRVVNPDPSISVVSKTIPGIADPVADGNGQAAATGAWPWVVNSGEVPIVTHNGVAYAFTGGPGSWGTTAAGTALTAAMFTPLGASAGVPENKDWSSRAEADLGAAYAAFHAGAGAPDFGSGAVFVQWKDGKTYLLTTPSAPAVSGSYTAIASSKPEAHVTALDWTGVVGATITDAYAAWHALSPLANVLDPTQTTIIKYGSPAGVYIVTDATHPAVVGSYYQLVSGADAVDFIGNADITAAFDPTKSPTMAGQFMMVKSDGALYDPGGTAATPTAAPWPIDGVAVGTALKKGDLLIWDGAKFHHMPQDVDLSAYLELAGGAMADGAVIHFDTTTAKAGAGSPSVTIIDGDGGTIDHVVIDGGTY